MNTNFKLELFQPSTWTQNSNHQAVDISALPKFIFESETSFLFLNDQLNNERKLEIQQQLELLIQTTPIINEPSLLIPTSGTTSHLLKIVVLKKRNFLNAAKRANAVLKSTPQDTWLASLPLHHVAGLSILARAYLNQNKTYYWTKWDAQIFAKNLNQLHVNFCSLVPTQIFDLITVSVPAPKHLKTVLVGGSALPNQYWQQMVDLGWPLLKTFGMTETAAFMSTSSQSDKYYDPLPNVEIKLDKNERLAIKTDSLFEGYIQEIVTPGRTRTSDIASVMNGIRHKTEANPHWQFQPAQLNDGFWSAEDRAELLGNQFQILGRDQGIIKIKGELVNTQLLTQRLNDVSAEMSLGNHAPILHFAPNERDEHELFAVVTKSQDEVKLKTVIKRFNDLVLPFERINWYILVDEIPRTDLGKVKTSSFNTDSFKESYFENRQSIL
jgi:O-succinylbenzoic acid--CoA ligase